MGRFGVVVPALARMAQQCDVERQPEAVLRAPARTDQIKIIIGQKIVALQRSDVGTRRREAIGASPKQWFRFRDGLE